MSFTSKLSPEQWAEARRLRAEGATFAALAGRFSVTASTIGDRARREGWATPAAAAAHPAAHSGAGKGKRVGFAAVSAATAAMRQRLTKRLYTIMDNKLELMELRMQQQLKKARKAAKTEGGEIPVGDEEQDTRALATVFKTIDQVTELDSDVNRTANGGAKPGDPDAASEADAFRREIAERIEKLIPPS